MIRRFLKGIDDLEWAELAHVSPEEFEASINDPEFSDEGMYVAEVDARIVGIANAHISPSCPEFSVLRNFTVCGQNWDMVASSLVDVALKSFADRGAKAVEISVSEEAARCISLLKTKGFTATGVNCTMKHDLRHLEIGSTSKLALKTYAEVNDPGLIEKLQNKIFKGLIGRPVTKEEVMFWMRNLEFECFLGYLGRTPVASSFCEIKTVNNKRQGWIYGLGVLPKYRRGGIGTELLRNVLSFIKSKDTDSAFVETDYSSHQQRFYESAGFQVESKAISLEKKF